MSPVNDHELARYRRILGVKPGITRAELERAFMDKNLAIIREKNSASAALLRELEAEHEELRAAFAAVGADTEKPRSRAERAQLVASSLSTREAVVARALLERAEPDTPALLAFDNWKVNTFVPPLLLLFAWLVNQSPFVFFLRGFHVWVHELGHAVPAWLSGKQALPLPIGWTVILPDYSPFVHWGLLLLFSLRFVAGIRERKIWPALAAAGLAALQHYMTWRMPDYRQEFWYGSFGGVGGEFIISTLFMLVFYVRLPEKFRWEWCRYLFFFLGASALIAIWTRWIDVYHGVEEIPFGSMIAGEDDANGDMNGLLNEYGWNKFKIRRTYYLLGQGCWLVLGLAWAAFVLRLDRLAGTLFSGLPSRETPDET